MRAQDLLANLGLFADAAGGSSRLRELILDLAMRGRLVDQLDTEGEAPTPTFEDKTIPTIDETEGAPHEIPRSWRWWPLDRVFEPVSSQGKKILVTEVRETGKYPVVDQGQILVRGYTNRDDAVIRPPRPVTVFGDHTRQVKYVDFPFVAGADGTKILLPKGIVDPRFFFWCIRAFRIEARGYGRHYARLLGNQLPLPPLAEQKRIVAKVDQLMALCDDLEAQQTKKRDLATQSTRSALIALTTAESPQEFTTAWTRVLETWPMLLDHSGKVEEVRRSMLELALRGGLATQAAGDTTAGTLLQGIDAYWSEESRSKQRPSETDQEFEGEQLPSGWARCRVGRIIRISSGDALPSHAMTKGGKIPVYGGNGVTGYHDAANLSRASIVMGRVGFYCGSVHLTPDQAWVTDNAFVISYPNDFLDQKFLYWLLLRIGRVVRQDGGATAQPVISGKKLYPLFVMLPPREEQSRIAKRLEHLMRLCDDLEAKLRKQEETATRLAESLAAAVAA